MSLSTWWSIYISFTFSVAGLTGNQQPRFPKDGLSNFNLNKQISKLVQTILWVITDGLKSNSLYWNLVIDDCQREKSSSILSNRNSALHWHEIGQGWCSRRECHCANFWHGSCIAIVILLLLMQGTWEQVVIPDNPTGDKNVPAR